MVRRKDLQAFIDIVPFLGDIINEDIDIGVMDSQKFIITQGGKTLRSDAKAGDKNKYDEAALSVIRGKKTLSFEDLSGHFAVPVEVTFTPVMEDDGKSSDVLIAVVKNIERRKASEMASKKIGESFEQVDKALSGIALGSQVLSQSIDEIAAYTQEMREKLSKIDALIGGIKKISLKSNILAINAGVEAVNAGSVGKGFGVIAKEIGNLAKSSDHTAEDITKMLNEIKNSIETVNSRINKLSAYSSTQAASSRELSSTMNDIYKSFKVLTSER